MELPSLQWMLGFGHGERGALTDEGPTFERRDSGDSSMWSSSELSISSSMPVIFPARLGCIVWMRGKRRSPGAEMGREKEREREIKYW